MAIYTAEIFNIKNGSEVVIRSYELSDVDEAIYFANQVAQETKHTLKYEGMPPMPKNKLLETWEENIKHPVNLNLGVFFRGSLIGNLRFFQRSSNHPWIRHIGSFGMAMRQSHWGQGLGSRLLSILDAHARSCGICRIEAEVRANNSAGISLYTKCGYKVEGRREKAALIDGVYVDEFYIAKILEDLKQT